MDEQSRSVTGYPAPVQPAADVNANASATNPNSNHNGYAFNTTSGTAYAYAAPPPPQQPPYYYNQNPYYYDHDPHAARRATFIRRIFSVIIAAIIVSGTIAFIIWLILRPRLPEFRVDSLSLSKFNVSSSPSLSGNWEVQFTVYNPNKKITLGYERVDATIFYKSEYLAQTTVHPFFQETRNQATVTASFAASSAYVDPWVVDDINKGRTGGGVVVFNVRLQASVRLKAKALPGRRRFLSVFCRDLTVGIPSNGSSGSLTGGSKQCVVGL